MRMHFCAWTKAHKENEQSSADTAYNRQKQKIPELSFRDLMVDGKGLEPLTSCTSSRRSTS